MKTALKQITTIQTGLYMNTLPKGEVVYLQSKHFDDDGKLKTNLHPDLRLADIAEKHLLIAGDVLFAAKGTKNFATVYEAHNVACVASTSFFVIRPKHEFQDKILPEFLSWTINHPTAQTFLKGKALGSSIASISKVVLEELEISIPPINRQRNILKIHELWKHEQRLRKQIDSLKEKQIQAKLFTACQL